MKKTAASTVLGGSSSYFYYLESVLIFLLPIRQHMDYIFSKVRLSLAAPCRFWKCMNEFRRKRAFLFSFVCLCFLFLFCFCSEHPSVHSSPKEIGCASTSETRAADAGVLLSCGFSTQCQEHRAHLAGLLHAEWETQVLLYKYALIGSNTFMFPFTQCLLKLSSLLDLVYKYEIAYIWSPLWLPTEYWEPEVRITSADRQRTGLREPLSRGFLHCHFPQPSKMLNMHIIPKL